MTQLRRGEWRSAIKRINDILCSKRTQRHATHRVWQDQAKRSESSERSKSRRTLVPDDFQHKLEQNPQAKAFETLNGQNRYAICYRIPGCQKT